MSAFFAVGPGASRGTPGRPALRLVGQQEPPEDLRAKAFAETVLRRAEARFKDRMLLLLAHTPGPDLSVNAGAIIAAGRARGLQMHALVRPDQAAAARAAGLSLAVAGRFDLVIDPCGGAEPPLDHLTAEGRFLHPGVGRGVVHLCDPYAMGLSFPREVFPGLVTLSTYADLNGDCA